MAFHESRVVIIETGRRVVRAGLGLGELLHIPSVEMSARVGLRRATMNGTSSHGNPDARVSDYLVGPVLDDALANGENVEVYWPFSEGKIGNWAQAEAIWKYILFQRLGIRRQLNECPVLLALPAKLSRMTHMLLCRMFFERFNVAGFTSIERPLATLYAANLISGILVDIGEDETDIVTVHESLIRHGSSIVIPIGIRDCERYLAHILRTNTSVMSVLAPPDQPPPEPKQLDILLLGLARYLWKSGHIKIPAEGEPEPEDEGTLDIAALLVAGRERAIIEAAGNKKKSQQNKADKEREREMAALDLVTVQYLDLPPITVGRERHRFCDPLFDPQLLSTVSIPQESLIEMDRLTLPPPPHPKDPDFVMPIPTAMHSIIRSAPFNERPHVYFGIVITGQLANIHGLPIAFQGRLTPFLCTDRQPSDTPTPGFQPTLARPVKVPEYFAEFRDKGDLLSAFLGCGIAAKLTFGDSSGRNFVSKAQYGERGPVSLLELTPTVL